MWDLILMAEPDQSTSTTELAAIASGVEARSAVFKKELGLFDLVLTQVAFVVGTVWVGWAAKLGNHQMAFWLLAIIPFYWPLAAAVTFSIDRRPSRGGLLP